MATKYKATITVKCWKRHECVGCGAAYKCKFVRTVTGEAGSEAAAGVAAEKAAQTAINKDVDQRPCPKCGCLQPDMVGQQKGKRHLLLTVLLLVPAALAVIFGFVQSATWISYSTAAMVVGAVGLVGVLLHALVALANPNGNKDANLRTAERFVEGGEMKELEGEDTDLATGEPKVTSGMALPLLGAAALGALIAFAPAVFKLVGGWPTAAGTKPEVVGPGDTVRVYFPDKIEAVQGKWKGGATAGVSVDGKPVSGVSAKTNNDSWGTTIRGKSVSNSTPSLWVDVSVPNDPALAGKTVDVKVDLTLQYPHGQAGGFDEMTSNFSRTEKYTLAPPGTAGTYQAVYWATVLGAVLFTVAGFCLVGAANGLRKHAATTEVLPLGGKRRRDDDEEEDEDDRPRRAKRSRDEDEDGDGDGDREYRRRRRDED